MNWEEAKKLIEAEEAIERSVRILGEAVELSSYDVPKAFAKARSSYERKVHDQDGTPLYSARFLLTSTSMVQDQFDDNEQTWLFTFEIREA